MPTSNHAGVEFLGRMAALAFVFVILGGIGAALTAVSLPLPRGGAVVTQVLGYGLQIFAAIWFIAVAVEAWRLFVKADKAV